MRRFRECWGGGRVEPSHLPVGVRVVHKKVCCCLSVGSEDGQSKEPLFQFLLFSLSSLFPLFQLHGGLLHSEVFICMGCMTRIAHTTTKFRLEPMITQSRYGLTNQSFVDVCVVIAKKDSLSLSLSRSISLSSSSPLFLSPNVSLTPPLAHYLPHSAYRCWKTLQLNSICCEEKE